MIFLRKKVEGENSIEEFARRVARATGAIVKECPHHSTTLLGMLRNIAFARRERGKTNHIIAQTESYLCLFLGGSKIVTFHDMGTIYASRNRLFKMLRILLYVKTAEFFSDAITFVSKQTRCEFEKQLWKRKLKLRVIYNTYDERLIPNDTSDLEQIPIILQIGTGARKNLESTILAAKGLNVKLVIIGKLRDSQISMLKENGVKYENAFDIPYEDYVVFYNRAKIVVFPTFYEGFGLPVVEAQVMKKPVVASDLEIIREVGGNGVFYINPNDVGSIRCAIVSLLDDKGKYRGFVSAGIENAKRFSSESIYPQYEELYRCLEDGQ